jgi:hypothetical protein
VQCLGHRSPGILISGPNHILPALENNQRYVYEINLSWTSNWRNDLHSYQLSTQTASNTAFSVVTRL